MKPEGGRGAVPIGTVGAMDGAIERPWKGSPRVAMGTAPRPPHADPIPPAVRDHLPKDPETPARIC